jgi:hypothetical protein
MSRYTRRHHWWWQIIGRSALIITAALVVVMCTLALVRVLPRVLPGNRPDGGRRVELRARRSRPARERRVASISRGLPDLALQFLMVGGIAWGGRRILRLRLKE